MVKTIIVFVSDEEKMKARLSESNKWLLPCSYPFAIIEKSSLMNLGLKEKRYLFRLQQHTIANFDSKSISITANSLLSNSKDNKLNKIFGKGKVIYQLKHIFVFFEQTGCPK